MLSTFSGCGFFLGTVACLAVIASTLSAQETSATRWTPAPTIPSDLAPKGQPFLSLLDDVTIHSEPEIDGYFSFVAQCQLNAPIDNTVAESNSTPSDSELQWAELLTYQCNDKACRDSSTVAFTNCPQSCGAQSCTFHSESSCLVSCASCTKETIQESSESYCEQVSQILATTLNGSQASFEAKSEAIKSAMKMVTEKTLADAELQINELKIAHQKQIDQLQDQLLDAKGQSESTDQIISWLRPIYSNQNRNYQQLQQLMADQNDPPTARRPQVEPLVEPLVEKPEPMFDRSQLPSSVRIASKSMAERSSKRKAEIAKLKHEIEVINARLSELVDQPVQPATHLEPVYIPGPQLVPIPSVPERHSNSKKLDPNQRLDRIR